MSQPEAPPSTGLIAGKYHLVSLIGRGGMGSVWEARHTSLGTRFAIKFIEAEYADSTEARSRFDKEARAAATIQSKHAIQIFDHGVTEDGKPYIVMELLQGEPLDKRIDKLGRLPLQDTARILQQVCRGLARAHDRGIVHRDLKPENIFLVRTPDDDDEIAKVLDFGIAKIQATAENPNVTSGTKTGAVLGTPFYMSPEQARGLRNVDHRTDLWSLGVIAFKCVTGRLPFDGESVGDLLVKICTAPLPVPSQIQPGLPASFDAWFTRALEREPERRFGSAQELSEALAIASGIPVRGVASSAGNPLPLAAQPTLAPSARTPGSGSAGRPGSSPSIPPTAGMTAAPFTSSAVPGVPSGRGRLLIVSVMVGALLVGGLVGGAMMLTKRPTPTAATGLVAGDRPTSPAAHGHDDRHQDAKPADAPTPDAGAGGSAAAADSTASAKASAAKGNVPTTPSVHGAPGTNGANGTNGTKPTAPQKPATPVVVDKPPPLPPASTPGSTSATTGTAVVVPPPPPPTAKKPSTSKDPGY